jgi:hypothetical protein
MSSCGNGLCDPAPSLEEVCWRHWAVQLCTYRLRVCYYSVHPRSAGEASWAATPGAALCGPRHARKTRLFAPFNVAPQVRTSPSDHVSHHLTTNTQTHSHMLTAAHNYPPPSPVSFTLSPFFLQTLLMPRVLKGFRPKSEGNLRRWCKGDRRSTEGPVAAELPPLTALPLLFPLPPLPLPPADPPPRQASPTTISPPVAATRHPVPAFDLHDDAPPAPAWPKPSQQVQPHTPLVPASPSRKAHVVSPLAQSHTPSWSSFSSSPTSQSSLFGLYSPSHPDRDAPGPPTSTPSLESIASGKGDLTTLTLSPRQDVPRSRSQGTQTDSVDNAISTNSAIPDNHDGECPVKVPSCRKPLTLTRSIPARHPLHPRLGLDRRRHAPHLL